MTTSADSAGALTAQERLQERLADPRTVEALDRLLDRLDVIAFTAEALESFLRRAEVVSDSVASGLADLRRMAGQDADASEIVARLPQVARAGMRMAEVAEKPEVTRLLESGLLEKLAEPRTLENLRTVLDKLDVITFSLEAFDGFLKRGDQVVESMAAGAQDLRQVLPEIDGEKVGKVAAALPGLVDAGSMLAESGMFDPKVVNVLADLGRTVVESRDALRARPVPEKTLGLFELMRVMRDPAVQQVLRFAIEVAKRYSRQLR